MDNLDSILSRAPVFKRIDDPWIGLLVLGIFIFITSIIAMIVLCFLWRRHQKHTQFYNGNSILSNKPTGKKQIPIQIDNQQVKPYETQKMEMFVPPNNEERFQTHFIPHNDMQQAHQYYERATKAYF